MSQAPATERSTPLSVRFTDAEKARLKDLAGSRPVGQYIRDQALQGESVPRAARRSPVKDAEPQGSAPIQMSHKPSPLSEAPVSYRNRTYNSKIMLE